MMMMKTHHLYSSKVDLIVDRWKMTQMKMWIEMKMSSRRYQWKYSMPIDQDWNSNSDWRWRWNHDDRIAKIGITFYTHGHVVPADSFFYDCDVHYCLIEIGVTLD